MRPLDMPCAGIRGGNERRKEKSLELGRQMLYSMRTAKSFLGVHEEDK